MLQQREYATFKTQYIAHAFYGLSILVDLIASQLLDQ
jgi:hypothetical protein